jgi:multidrug efflux pump subunit AcrA (membrane-fusion protein)
MRQQSWIRNSWNGALGAAILLAGFGCRRNGADAAQAPADPVVLIGGENLAVAELTELKSGPNISGTLQPKVEARVRSELMGPVERTFVDEGQRVRRGMLLARLEDQAVHDAYLSARSAVRTA